MKNNVIITSENAVDYNMVYAAVIEEKRIYLYLKYNTKDNNYTVYSVSEKDYLEIIKWHKFNFDNADFIGTIGANEDLNLWIENEQKTKKAFGKTKDNSEKIATLVLSLILLAGLLLLSFGIYRISYKKILESRMVSTTGTVISYNHQSRNGTVMMGLYNLYVEYTVDGQRYEGHSGTTATEPTVGMSTTVYYDSKHPSRTIVLDEMGERTILFIVIGGAIAVVSVALMISQGTFTKKNRKYKVYGTNTVHYTTPNRLAQTITNKECGPAGTNSSSDETASASIFDESLKSGFYTIYNGNEYQVICIKDEITELTSVYLLTDDQTKADATFEKNLPRYEEFYTKKIKPSLLGDVTEYSIDYYYLGQLIGLDKPAKNAENVPIFTTKKAFATKNGFHYLDRNVYERIVPVESIKARQINKGLTSHIANIEALNANVIKLKELAMRDKKAKQLYDIIFSRVDKNSVNLQNFHVGEFVEAPNQFGCFKKNTAWFSYSIDEKNFATITGPFNEKAVVYACAKMLNATDKFGDFKFTDKERNVYIESNYHSIKNHRFENECIENSFMTIDDLKNQLIERKVPTEFYSLNGGLPNECLCLSHEEGIWEIYYSERGNKTGLKRYDNESEACEVFLEKIGKMMK